jgi:GT2 family glycosyltransferase
MPQASHSPSSILAVIVVYNCEFSASKSASSLLQILKESPELARHFSLVLYDNSAQPQSPPTSDDFAIHYVHDASNGGLAAAYNFALARAEAEEREWLLLFDQDTSPTREFLRELVAATGSLHEQARVAAIVPKLVVRGKVLSPTVHFIDQLRRQYKRSEQVVSPDVSGMQQGRLGGYNSAATLRVSALRSILGFPREFWLDYLDHTVFHTLFVKGYRTYVMHATLAHDSSHAEIESVPTWRMHNVLLAQTLFVKQSGNFFDQLLYRIWLLRYSRTLRRLCKDPQVWKETALQALRLRVPGRET